MKRILPIVLSFSLLACGGDKPIVPSGPATSPSDSEVIHAEHSKFVDDNTHQPIEHAGTKEQQISDAESTENTLNQPHVGSNAPLTEVPAHNGQVLLIPHLAPDNPVIPPSLVATPQGPPFSKPIKPVISADSTDFATQPSQLPVKIHDGYSHVSHLTPAARQPWHKSFTQVAFEPAGIYTNLDILTPASHVEESTSFQKLVISESGQFFYLACQHAQQFRHAFKTAGARLHCINALSGYIKPSAEHPNNYNALEVHGEHYRDDISPNNLTSPRNIDIPPINVFTGKLVLSDRHITTGNVHVVSFSPPNKHLVSEIAFQHQTLYMPCAVQSWSVPCKLAGTQNLTNMLGLWQSPTRPKNLDLGLFVKKDASEFANISNDNGIYTLSLTTKLLHTKVINKNSDFGEAFYTIKADLIEPNVLSNVYDLKNIKVTNLANNRSESVARGLITYSIRSVVSVMPNWPDELIAEIQVYVIIKDRFTVLSFTRKL